MLKRFKQVFKNVIEDIKPIFVGFPDEDGHLEQDTLTLRPKEVLLFRFPEDMPQDQVVYAAQRIAETVNQDDNKYQNGVLILQEGMELETVPVEELENILEHVHDLEKQNEENNNHLDDRVIEGLNDLIPKEAR